MDNRSRRLASLAAAAVVLGLVVDSNGWWTRRFDADGWSGTDAILPLAGGGFLAAGTHGQGGSGTGDLLLMKVNDIGEEEWSLSEGDSLLEYGRDLAFASDGGVVAVAVAYDTSRSKPGCLLVKATEAGELVWSRRLAGGCDCIVALPDGRLFTSGSFVPRDSAGPDLFLMALDSAGGLLWSRRVENEFEETAADLLLLADGSIVALANRLDPMMLTKTVRMLKIDPSDSSIVESDLDPGADFAGYTAAAAIELPGGDIAVTGQALAAGGENADLWLARFSGAGDLVWSRGYGHDYNPEAGRSLRLLPDSSLIATGSRWMSMELGDDVLLLKTDLAGGEVWTKVFGTRRPEAGSDLALLADGNIALDAVSGASARQRPLFRCLLPDQYARAGVPFAYQIPYLDRFDLPPALAPIALPAGMTLSADGLMDWTPQGDSARRETARVEVNTEFQIDTLELDIFVNTGGRPLAVSPRAIPAATGQRPGFRVHFYRGAVVLETRLKVAACDIHELSGRREHSLALLPQGADRYAALLEGGSLNAGLHLVRVVSPGRVDWAALLVDR